MLANVVQHTVAQAFDGKTPYLAAEEMAAVGEYAQESAKYIGMRCHELEKCLAVDVPYHTFCNHENFYRDSVVFGKEESRSQYLRGLQAVDDYLAPSLAAHACLYSALSKQHKRIAGVTNAHHHITLLINFALVRPSQQFGQHFLAALRKQRKLLQLFRHNGYFLQK